jgi:hypothetical protein
MTASDVPAGVEPKTEFHFSDDAPAYPCELRIHVNKAFKALKILDTTNPLLVLSYLPLPSCSPTYDGVTLLLGRPALWLLRTDHGITRTTLGDRPTVYPIDAWSALSDEA